MRKMIFLAFTIIAVARSLISFYLSCKTGEYNYQQDTLIFVLLASLFHEAYERERC